MIHPLLGPILLLIGIALFDTIQKKHLTRLALFTAIQKHLETDFFGRMGEGDENSFFTYSTFCDFKKWFCG